MDSKNFENKAKELFIKLSKRKKVIKIGAALGLTVTLFYPSVKENNNLIGASLVPVDIQNIDQIGSFEITVPNLRYGFALDTFLVEEGRVVKNQTFGGLLTEKGLDMLSIETLVQNSKDVFDISRYLRAGQEYLLLSDRASGKPKHIIFEPSVYDYVIFNLQDELTVQKVERQVEVELRSVNGQIENSLWEALTASQVDPEAAAKMEDALECYVDFSHTQQGDKFKLLFEQKYIAGKPVGSGQVFAAYYQRDGKDNYAFWYDDGQNKGFYDYDGQSAKKGFLKSPLKFTRISSKFNMRRFHPILKTVRPHLGTDFAAPTGTPIHTIGEGVVEEVAYSKGNGKYVKIRHDKTYQTQYLHMSRFAKGIKRGTKVAQGQVIGYVGSTGLATGPHVCFRFWKNGRQVNFLREKLPPQSKKLAADKLADYFKIRDKYLTLLSQEGVINTESFQQIQMRSSPVTPVRSGVSP